MILPVLLTGSLMTGCSLPGISSPTSSAEITPAPQETLAGADQETEVTQEAAEIPGETVAEAAPLEAAPLTAETVDPAQAETAAETPAEAPAEPAAETPALPEGQMYSFLTGEPVSTEIGMKRPFAVMINNLQPAIPQSGIAKADILYEAMVEGSITRLMAVFQNITDVGQLGPVRSSRHYYLYMADDLDAIYTHFGWSPFAQSLIETQGRQTINGSFYDGDGNFYRTSDREAPHNAYATGQGLLNIATDRGMPLTHDSSFQSGMKFHTADTPLENGEPATRVDIPFNYDTPYFEYNEAEKVYYRWEYGAPHIDMETNQQLSFKNIIVLYVAQQVISDYGHLDLGLYGNMDGLYITDGKAIPITGIKDDGPTQYFDLNGNEILLNPGKTMIEYVPDDAKVTFDGAAPIYGSDQSGSGEGAAEAEEDMGAAAAETPVYNDNTEAPVYYDYTEEPVYYAAEEPVYYDNTETTEVYTEPEPVIYDTGAAEGGEVYTE